MGDRPLDAGLAQLLGVSRPGTWVRARLSTAERSRGDRLPTALLEAGQTLGEDLGSLSGSQTSAGISLSICWRHVTGHHVRVLVQQVCRRRRECPTSFPGDADAAGPGPRSEKHRGISLALAARSVARRGWVGQQAGRRLSHSASGAGERRWGSVTGHRGQLQSRKRVLQRHVTAESRAGAGGEMGCGRRGASRSRWEDERAGN